MAYLTLAKKTLQAKAFYPWEILLSNFNIIVQAIVAISVGLSINSASALFTKGELAIYYLFGMGVINIFQRNIPVKKIEEDIKLGQASIHFTKPYNYIIFNIVRDYASKLYDSVITFIAVFIIIALMIGIPNLSLPMMLRAAIILPLTILYLALNVTIFMYLAFLIERSGRLASTYSMISFFFAGGLLPTQYLPKFITYLPQQFYFNSPLVYIIRGEYINFPLWIAYAIALCVINISLDRYVTRRLELNGG